MVVSTRRLLITGCNGFIGKSLAEVCLAEGWTVKGGIRSPLQTTRLPSGVEPVVIGDVGSKTEWSNALNQVNVVVHLAAAVHSANNEHGRSACAAAYFETNLVGTARLARAAAETGVDRLVFLSTLKVHGEGRPDAYREIDSAGPSGSYAVSKYEAENILAEIGQRSGLKTVILRPPLVYGPGVKANFLKLMHMIARGIPLPLSRVANRRSLVYLGNLVDGILTCLTHPAAAGNTFLIADDETVSTPALVRSLAQTLQVRPKLFALPQRLLECAAAAVGKRSDMRRLTGSLWADTSKIRNELGWRPKFRLLEGLAATASWYRASPAAPRVGQAERPQ